MTGDQLAELKSPEWIYQDLIIRGHLVLIVAEPNGGKTTIFRHLAGDFSTKGYRVVYVNADISGAEAAEFAQQAEDEGWNAILPDCIPGRSIKDVFSNLRTMNESGRDLSEMVFIFDTLKKLGDVISKSSMRELLALLRSLSAKGATIICLGHTNKYPGADGKPVYEGVGDLRADVDELIYLLPKKNDDGSMTVSTLPNKVRGDFQAITFCIKPDRRVERAAGYIDVEAQRIEEDRFRRDQVDIKVIEEAIATGCEKQYEIVDHCRGAGMSIRRTRALLDRYGKGQYQRWTIERLGARNALVYRPLDSDDALPRGM
jgi:KaiC/GvpD/RAD55 family RecA-like ATPase